MSKESNSRLTAAAARWFLRRASGTETDGHRFFRWLRERPGALREFDALETTWAALGSLRGEPEIERELRVPARERAVGGWRRLAAAAAVAILACGLAAGVAFRGPAPARLSAEFGERRIYALADGSTLMLNAGAEAAVRIDDRRRELTLAQGEAFFEVAHDPARPFAVLARKTRLTALGTAFNVRLTAEETRIDVLDGRVAVAEASAPAAAGLVVSAGQGLGVDARGRAGPLDEAQALRIAAWRSGRLELADTPLAEAIAEMNRHSKVRLELTSPDLGSRRISGSFALGEQRAFGEALAAMGVAEVEHSGDVVRLSPPREP